MSETTTSAENVRPEEQHAVSLDEFCTRLSRKVKSPEMIAAFHHLEKAAGRVTALSSAYQARFEEVSSRPSK